jgi:hypothetical protein
VKGSSLDRRQHSENWAAILPLSVPNENAIHKSMIGSSY